MSMVINILAILIALSLPIILMTQGKRLLGSQTHPAALFILSWMGCSFSCSLVNEQRLPNGPLALVWVTLCFTVGMMVKKLRNKPPAAKSE
jgi:hypothetical protein